MGLDLTLGGLILIAALRGWFRGFMLQVVGLSALIGSVYLAEPIRDFARPYGVEYLPKVGPEILDRLLWWTSAVLSYALMTGLGTSLVRAYRRRPYSDPELNRGDKGAGFLLGAMKGAIVAAFIAAGLSSYAPTYVKPGGVIEDQTRQSLAMSWSDTYKPAERIWNSVPVRHFVARIRENGLNPSESTETAKKKSVREDKESTTPAPVQTASRPRSLALPRPADLDPNSPRFLDELDARLRNEGLDKSR